MKKKLALILAIVIAVTAMAITAYAVTVINEVKPGTQSTANTGENPEDATKYISTTSNDIGGTHYSWTTGTSSSDVTVGQVVRIGDYKYVYGYRYDGTAAVSNSNTRDNSWVALDSSDENFGWGCAAISKTKTSYGDPCGHISHEPVTYFDNCYRNCTSMTNLPVVPHTAKSTTNLCRGCSALKTAELNGLTVLGNNAFTGCSTLDKVYIGESVISVPATSSSASPFYNASASCKVFAEVASKPSGWGSYYRGSVTSANFVFDSSFGQYVNYHLDQYPGLY